MLSISVVLYCLAALASLGMAYKYGLGPVPADYHVEILGDEVPADTVSVLWALYRVFGAAIFGIAILAAALAAGPVAAGDPLARIGLPLGLLVFLVPAFIVAHRMAGKYGVNTPTRPTLAFIVVILLSAVLSFL